VCLVYSTIIKTKVLWATSMCCTHTHTVNQLISFTKPYCKGCAVCQPLIYLSHVMAILCSLTAFLNNYYTYQMIGPRYWPPAFMDPWPCVYFRRPRRKLLTAQHDLRTAGCGREKKIILVIVVAPNSHSHLTWLYLWSFLWRPVAQYTKLMGFVFIILLSRIFRIIIVFKENW
jgi:hypothetical protein